MKSARSLSKIVTQFAKGEDGNATYFASFIIMMMVLVGGLGVDLMRNELERTKLQNTLDRAVLAAADLDQTLTPAEVVADYFDKAGLGDTLSNVTVSQGDNYRTVTATASATTTTQFMHLTGVDTLNAPAIGTAEERKRKVEISLVLDISGSMGRNNRMPRLQAAAIEFAQTVLTPETADMVSLTIVPYSEHVNPGELVFQHFPNINQVHTASWCVEFEEEHYASAAVDFDHPYDQMQHFDYAYHPYNQLERPVCPSESYEEIRPLSQDLAAIEAQLNQLQPRWNTSIFMGMKWGTAFLDPSMRGVVGTLVDNGRVDPEFANRPADYTDSDTLKMVVVMTDGKNTQNIRIYDWAYDSASDVEHWINNNFMYWLRNNVYSYYHQYFYYMKYSDADGDRMLAQVCDAAKNKGIIVWGIGYEVNDHGADVLENCSSSPSHFYRVEGVEISDAFGAIAGKIADLRLTQ